MQNAQTIKTLPRGYRLRRCGAIDSTNAEALRAAHAGAASGLWILAERQTNGRGRLGRGWTSPPGNLYASLLLRPGTTAPALSGLPLVAGVALHDAVRAMGHGRNLPARLNLKWPNDLMTDGAKLGGILVEGASMPCGPAVIVGIGLNLAHAPEHLGRPASCLRAAGLNLGVDTALAAVAHAMAAWLDVWCGADGFAAVRGAWLERADAPGAPISVKLHDGALSGRFCGIDEQGALRLGLADGAERIITAGDVVLDASGKHESVRELAPHGRK
jgi:BirA family biotin operon repressor/biotin-[acetyl-CoA-carboxylase] ligase